MTQAELLARYETVWKEYRKDHTTEREDELLGELDDLWFEMDAETQLKARYVVRPDVNHHKPKAPDHEH